MKKFIGLCVLCFVFCVLCFVFCVLCFVFCCSFSLAQPGDAADHEHCRGGIRNVVVAHVEAVDRLAHISLGQVGRLLAALHRHHLVIAQHLGALGRRRLVEAVLEAGPVDALCDCLGSLEGGTLSPDSIVVVIVLLLACGGLGRSHAPPTAASGSRIGAHDGHLVGACAGGLHPLASHLLVEAAHRDVREGRRAASDHLAPKPQVVGHGLLAGVDDGLLALTIAAGTAQEALQVGVVLAADAVIEHADVGVVHGLGGVEHVLEEDEGVALWGDLKQCVDVVHLHGGRIVAHLRPLLGVPGDDVTARKGLREYCTCLGLLAVARADDVVEGRGKGLHHALQPSHCGCVGLAAHDQVLRGANAPSHGEGLHGLVLLAGLKADHACRNGAAGVAHDYALGRVCCTDGKKTHVALVPPLAGAEACHLRIDHARPVARGRGNVALVKDNQHIGQDATSSQRVECGDDLGQTTAVLDASAHAQGEAVPGLLQPRIVAHASDDEHAVGRDAEQPGVGEHEADEGRDDASLSCLHLCRQVDPCTLGLGHEEVEEALHGCKELGLVRVLRCLCLGGRPAELGDPGRRAKAGPGHLELCVGKCACEALSCHVACASCWWGTYSLYRRGHSFFSEELKGL